MKADASRKLAVPLRVAAELLGVSERLLWSHTAPRGDIPVIRVGRRVLYDPQDLRAWLDRQKCGTAA